MKKAHFLLSGVTLISTLIWGCSKDNPASPSPPVRTFSGITQRNEFGDTLVDGNIPLVDPNDWVISGMPVATARTATVAPPIYSNDVRITQGQTSDTTLRFGAFPNPFISGTGRVLIDLFLPDTLDVEIYIVNESGTDSLVRADGSFPRNHYLIPWEGTDNAGNRLLDGIYRIFLNVEGLHSYGDVMITLSNPSDPASNASYLSYAQSYYDSALYYNWEWLVAAAYGSTGRLGGSNRFSGTLATWRSMDFSERFLYLPTFFNYDLSACTPYQYYHLLAYKHFQLGAGWFATGVYGPSDTTRAEYQYGNYYHDYYLTAFQGGP